MIYIERYRSGNDQANLEFQHQGGRNKQIPRELPWSASLGYLERNPVSTLTKTGDGS